MADPQYVMPAEWAPHRATWLSWPHKLESWPGKFEPVPAVFVELAAWLSSSEEVHINVLDLAMEAEVRRLLSESGHPRLQMERIFLHRIPTNDAWCRDHGPNFVYRTVGGEGVEKVILDWEYNAWGGKYEPYDDDNAVPSRIAEMRGTESVSTGMVLEGGAIDVNGRGLLLTTTACLLNPNRNPSMSREEIERELGRWLGIKKVLWLGEGIAGDDTDGHVDDMARFVSEDTVVIAVEDDPEDENYRPLRENYELLKGCTGLGGEPIRVVKLPMPDPVYYEGERLPASYANFYIANSVVLVPVYRCEKDNEALEVLRGCFPGREVVGIDCSDLIWGLGAIHCVTHEEPADSPSNA
ncbi:agmatine deiminase family protein [Chlorobium sp. N1]|uniref:agmatine deiminase family protein n=1 Tax=Chlorobium sp. N1 TaxID=2491138 RepID=UPI0010386B24|nr:agmatine deiminase family protein [Chlorobium sp. N1]TCD48667.1 agmatine deiminase family protein [Chlorobium sp. N1]